MVKKLTQSKTFSGINWIGLYTFIRREVERMFRITVQTIVSPLISAFLFIFIFGFVLGSRIDLIAGIPYMQFVFPGILMMNILSSSFIHSSSSVFFARFMRQIDEILVAPFSYIEIIIGFTVSAIIRAMIVGVGILLVGLLFGAVEMDNIILFFGYAIGVATIFALLGILVGLWSKGFEQLNILNTFVIMPLSMLGGMFYSVELLPEKAQAIAFFNPFFYFIDGMRFATAGIHESNLLFGGILILGLIIGLGALVNYLFKIGWRIRV